MWACKNLYYSMQVKIAIRESAKLDDLIVGDVCDQVMARTPGLW